MSPPSATGGQARALSAFPLLGYINSIPRNQVPFAAFTSLSYNWLVGNQRLLRRSGSLTQVNGVLESQWGALARRMISAALASLQDGYPTWLVLYVNESSKMATVAFSSTNASPATPRVIGAEFGPFHYAQPIPTGNGGVATFRALPHVYENEHGGYTLGRLVSAKQRQFAAAGSRDLVRIGSELAGGGYTSGGPWRWGSRFNDSASAGDEPFDFGPVGMTPPLQMPSVIAGNDLGTTPSAPFRGDDAFFYSVLFENMRGELSAYPVPLPPGARWAGADGFGYYQVSPGNPSHYFDSVVISNIPIGPPDTRRRWLIRSTKVTIASNSLAFPSPEQLYFWEEIPNNTQTTLRSTNGDDASLDTSPIPQELLGLVWPPCARTVGHYDGHVLLGNLKPSKWALLVAPWANGVANRRADDPLMYASPYYYFSVQPTQIVLRTITAGASSDETVPLAGFLLSDVVTAISAGESISNVTHNGTYSAAQGYYIPLTRNFLPGIQLGAEVSDVTIGMLVTGADWPGGTYVVGLGVQGGTGYTIVYVGKYPNATRNLPTTVTFVAVAINSSNPAPWGAMVVPGADEGAEADNLLRTQVMTSCTGITTGLATLTVVSASDASYISPGMLVYGPNGAPSSRYPAGTEVLSVVGAVVTLSDKATTQPVGAENVTFVYDTGDAVAETVLQTLTVSSGMTYSPSGTGGGFSGINQLSGVGDWADNNDATQYAIEVTAPMSPSALYQALAQGNVTGCTATTIYSVRVHIRAAAINSSGAMPVSIYPAVDGNSLGFLRSTYPAAQVLPYAYPTYVDYYFDLPFDPDFGGGGGGWGSGIPWTAASINAHQWGVMCNFEPAVAGDKAEISVSKFDIEIIGPGTTAQPGFVRSFGNALLTPLPFRKSYLDQFDPEPQTMIFSVASPGYAQDALNTYYEANRRQGPASLGPIVAFADMGAIAFVFFARGRMRFWNQRTGVTHDDGDYNLIASSFTRGLRSPYALCAGNQWCIFLADEGLFVVGIQLSLSAYRGDVIATDTAEVLLSKNLFDAERPDGARGELEYAMAKCIAASEGGTDDFAIHANVEGGVLYLNYQRSDGSRWQVRYDFSMGSGRTGIAEVLQDDGTPYPWSTPLNIGPSVSAKVAAADGKVHHYAAFDGNTGGTDGRVDEINTGTTDNGVPVTAIGNSGLAYASGLNLIGANVIRAIFTKQPPSGLAVGIALNPQTDPADAGAQFVDFSLDDSNMDDFGRAVVQTTTEAARGNAAIAFRLTDDGTGPPPELTQLRIDGTETPSVAPVR